MSETKPPRVALVAGINGAGKTTASQEVLSKILKIQAFVNADTIARGLNAFDPESEAGRAGRIMLAQLDELAAARRDFSFETTLAARTYSAFLSKLKSAGYEVHLYYFWLDSPETAIARVALRVRSGGHHIPEDTIRRRYSRSVDNFFRLYRPLCNYWRVYDNSGEYSRFIAFGNETEETILDGTTWGLIERSGNHE
jgi:predicted ABC-type ATPase